MSLYISDALVLTQQMVANPNAPRLCWENIVTGTNVTASSEEPLNPASNVGNPSTAFRWQATSTDEQYLDINTGLEIDYIGIARHNLEQDAEIKISFLVGLNYVTIFDWDNVPGRQVLLYFINQASPDGIRISIRNNPDPPQISVIYVGVATVLERNLYVGHTPINMGRDVTTIGSYSESGQYLGELVRREGRSSQIQLQNLTPGWYREELDPFIAQRPRRPAFFAWRPEKYPTEVGYIWVKGNPRPNNQRANGMMEITLDIEGIA